VSRARGLVAGRYPESSGHEVRGGCRSIIEVAPATPK